MDPDGTPYVIMAADCRIRRAKLLRSLDLIVDDTLTMFNHTEYISGKLKRGIGITKNK